MQLLDHLYLQPVVNVAAAMTATNVSWPTANKLIQQFEDKGLLREMTGLRRNRVYRYEPYLRLFADPDPVDPADLSSNLELTQGGEAAQLETWPEETTK